MRKLEAVSHGKIVLFVTAVFWCLCFYGLDMFHTEVVLGFKLLLFLHVVAQFRINGQQKWPVPYRYKDRTPFHVHSAL